MPSGYNAEVIEHDHPIHMVALATRYFFTLELPRISNSISKKRSPADEPVCLRNKALISHKLLPVPTPPTAGRLCRLPGDRGSAADCP